HGREPLHGVFVGPRDDEHQGRRGPGIWKSRSGRTFLHDEVRVRTADPERADSRRPQRVWVALPRFAAVDHAEARTLPVDAWARRREVQLRGEDFVRQTED